MSIPWFRTRLRLAGGTLAACSVAALLPTAVTAAPADTPVPFPSRPQGMQPPGPVGPAVDDPSGYQGQMACAVAPSKGVLKLRRLALSTYGRGYGDPYVRSCASGSTSEHKDGRAWDWMLDANNRRDRQTAGNFLAWATRNGGINARRLGIMYLIYNRKSWAAYDRDWDAYTGSDPHTSHIHISLSWNGARAHTSFWTGRTWAHDYGPCRVFAGQPAVTPGRKANTAGCPDAVPAPRAASGGLQWMGSAGDKVRLAQRLLGMDVTGTFTTNTRARVLRYQRAHDLPPTGAVDGATWGSLRPSEARGRGLGWSPREAAAFGRDNAGSPVLTRQSAGLATYALQVALRLPVASRSGYFADVTAAAVKRFKTKHGLASNAIVNEAVWERLPG